MLASARYLSPLTVGFWSFILPEMSKEVFSEDEFDQLECEVAAIFFTQTADEVEEAKDGRIASILRRVEQGRSAEEEELP
jgi:hypothetical protein